MKRVAVLDRMCREVLTGGEMVKCREWLNGAE